MFFSVGGLKSPEYLTRNKLRIQMKNISCLRAFQFLRAFRDINSLESPKVLTPNILQHAEVYQPLK